MAWSVILKRSAVPAKVPTTADLVLGELGINTFDGRLFTTKDAGSGPEIIEIATTNTPTKMTQPWDVTPDVVITPVSMSITSSLNMLEDETGELTLDLGTIGVSPGLYSTASGIVRTNVTLADLPADSALHVGYDITTADPTQVGYFVAVFADPTIALQDLMNQIFASALAAPNLYAASILAGESKQNQLGFNVINSTNPGGFIATHNATNATGVKVEVGIQHALIVGRNGTDFAVSSVVIDGASNYDLNVGTLIGDTPVVPSNLTLHYFLGTFDLGQGFITPALRPNLGIEPSSYTVAGTAFSEGDTKTNTDWTNLFPSTPDGPKSVSVTHAIFPTGTVVGNGYKVFIDPGYTGGFSPQPYGHAVSDGQVIVVDDVTASQEAFTVLLNGADRVLISQEIAGATAIAQNTANQLAALESTVNGTLTAIAVSTVNVDEMVFYVAHPSTLTGVGLPVETTYYTFYAAYLAMLDLPKTVRKRIILDDRLGSFTLVDTNAGSEATTVYQLVEYNITLSTYVAFNGQIPMPRNDPLGGSQGPMINFMVDGLLLDRFTGRLGHYNHYPYPEQLFTLGQATNSVYGTNNFIIGDNCSIWILGGYYGSFSTENGGNIVVGNNNYVSYSPDTFFDPYSRPAPINIIKGNGTYLYVTGPLPQLNGTDNSLVIYMPTRDDTLLMGYQTWFDVVFTGTSLVDIAPWMRIVRHPVDFNGAYGSPSTLGLYYPYYLVAGQLDMNGLTITEVGTPGMSCTIFGLPGSKLYNNTASIINANCVLTLDGLHLHTNTADYAVSAGSVTIRNSLVWAAKPLNNVVAMDNVTMLGNSSYQGYKQATSPIRLSNGSGVRCKLNNVRGEFDCPMFLAPDAPYGNYQFSNINPRVADSLVDFEAGLPTNGYYDGFISISNCRAGEGGFRTALVTMAGVAYDHYLNPAFDSDDAPPMVYRSGSGSRTLSAASAWETVIGMSWDNTTFTRCISTTVENANDHSGFRYKGTTLRRMLLELTGLTSVNATAHLVKVGLFRNAESTPIVVRTFNTDDYAEQPVSVTLRAVVTLAYNDSIRIKVMDDTDVGTVTLTNAVLTATSV